MKAYYSNRAQEYEKIYHREDPVRQAEQSEMSEEIQRLFQGKQVLEVACGTGYWTERLADAAVSITGVDASEETLQIARSKDLQNARFVQGDAYVLDSIDGQYDAALANFWFSHIPKSRINAFLKGLHEKLKEGSVVFMADNVLVEGVGGALVFKEGEEDTYKVRTLEEGGVYEILKNYYEEKELIAIFEPFAEGLSIYMGICFWWLSYTVKT